MAQPDAPQRWSALDGKLHNGLLQGLGGMGYEYMTPVQQRVLTELPTYQADCLVQAKTGTGKTLAFLLPALQSLLTYQSVPKGDVAILILSPTRELALQIAKECNAVTAKLNTRLECHTAYGGTSKEKDLRVFLNGDPKVLVATPGRLNDYLSDDYVAEKFSSLRTLILDEADQMLEAGFLVAINDILRRLPQKTRAQWQGMCFSATIPPKIQGVLPKILNKNHTWLSTVDPNETPTINRVPQFSLVVPSIADVYPALWALLLNEYASSPDNFKVIVFGTTANGVALMAALFTNLLGASNTIRVFQLQSRLSQANRTRTTNEFKEATAGIMFASDVIGRGMDFPNVSHVIQVGIPSSGDQYVHRVGRTARAGNEGRSIIIFTQRESYFLKTNRRLPISPYPVELGGQAIADQYNDVEKAFTSVDETTKAKAYQAWLGFNKTFMKQLQLHTDTLVAEANEYASAMGCPEPPMIDKMVVGKMGLKGVQGLNIGQTMRDAPGRGGGSRVRGSASSAQNQSTGRIEKPSSDKTTTNGQSRGGQGGRRGRGGRGGNRGGRSN